jgi:hypothetical protein
MEWILNVVDGMDLMELENGKAKKWAKKYERETWKK